MTIAPTAGSVHTSARNEPLPGLCSRMFSCSSCFIKRGFGRLPSDGRSCTDFATLHWAPCTMTIPGQRVNNVCRRRRTKYITTEDNVHASTRHRNCNMRDNGRQCTSRSKVSEGHRRYMQTCPGTCAARLTLSSTVSTMYPSCCRPVRKTAWSCSCVPSPVSLGHLADSDLVLMSTLMIGAIFINRSATLSSMEHRGVLLRTCES